MGTVGRGESPSPLIPDAGPAWATQENETERTSGNCWCQDFHFPEGLDEVTRDRAETQVHGSASRQWGWKVAEGSCHFSSRQGDWKGCVCVCVCTLCEHVIGASRPDKERSENIVIGWILCLTETAGFSVPKGAWLGVWNQNEG